MNGECRYRGLSQRRGSPQQRREACATEAKGPSLSWFALAHTRGQKRPRISKARSRYGTPARRSGTRRPEGSSFAFSSARGVRKGHRAGPNNGPVLIVPTEGDLLQASEESSSALWKCGNRRALCSRLTSCEDGRTAAGIPLLRIPALDTRCLSAASRATGCAWFPERILR